MAITSSNKLRDNIRLLEDRRMVQGQLLKEEFSQVVENLKPSNLIKNSISGVAFSPHVMRNIFIGVTGLVAAYFSRKKNKKYKSNLVRKLLATVIQTGIASLLAVRGEVIKEKIYSLFKNIFEKRAAERGMLKNTSDFPDNL